MGASSQPQSHGELSKYSSGTGPSWLLLCAEANKQELLSDMLLLRDYRCWHDGRIPQPGLKGMLTVLAIIVEARELLPIVYAPAAFHL